MRTLVCWFRRDLRVRDHTALYHAARDAERVTSLFMAHYKPPMSRGRVITCRAYASVSLRGEISCNKAGRMRPSMSTTGDQRRNSAPNSAPLSRICPAPSFSDAQFPSRISPVIKWA